MEELTPNQIESIVEKKLSLMEAEYALVKKYDDPNYKGAAHPSIDDLKQPQEDPQNEDSDEEFNEYQGYQKMDDCPEIELDKVDFDSVPHPNPFDKPLDVERIKEIMSQIDLPTPEWAKDPNAWKRMIGILKE